MVLRGKRARGLLLRTGAIGSHQRNRATEGSDILPRWADYGAFEGLAARLLLKYSSFRQ